MFNTFISIFFVLTSLIPVEIMKDSFGMIQVGVKIIPVNKANVDTLSFNIMNNIIDGPFLRASAFVVSHEKEETHLITSEHVCAEIVSFKLPKRFEKVKNSIMSAAEISDLFSVKYINNVLEVVPDIYVKDFYGNIYVFDQILKTDKKSDLCKFSTKKVWGKKSIISKEDCLYGEKVYNVSSSGGFYSKNSVPIREGLFSGVFLDTDKESYEKVKRNLYTILSLPGSSGSGVYNSQGTICGNINISFSKSDMSLGATRKNILEFLKN